MDSPSALSSLSPDSPALTDGPAGVRFAKKYYTDANGQVEPVDIVDGIEHGLFAPEKVLTEGEEIYYQYCSAFPIGAMVAMTWNTELAYEMGLADTVHRS